MKPTAKRQRGMSLIEALTTILIFSVGLMGLVGLQSRAIQVSTGAEDTNRAALLANELTSQMWLANSLSVDTTAWKDRVSKPEDGGLPHGVGTVTVTGNVADITITWRAPQAASGAQDNRYQTQVQLQ